MYVLLNIILALLISQEIEMYNQHDYKIVLDHVQLTNYNKDLFHYAYVKNVKPNRTSKAIEIGFSTKYDISGDKLKIHVEALQFFHNEYRRSPIVFDIKACQALEQKSFGIGSALSKNGNVTKCPVRKGNYLVHDFNFDESGFPPHIPRGKWKVVLRLMLGETTLCEGYGCGSVEDILKY